MVSCDAKRAAKRTIWWNRPLPNLYRETDGAVAVIFGLAASTLIALVGGAIDYAKVVSARTHLQSAVDAGVLAGGNALKLVVSSTESIVGLTTQTIQAEAKAGADAPISLQVRDDLPVDLVGRRRGRPIDEAPGPMRVDGQNRIVEQIPAARAARHDAVPSGDVGLFDAAASPVHGGP